jgi:hypothetical protein
VSDHDPEGDDDYLTRWRRPSVQEGVFEARERARAAKAEELLRDVISTFYMDDNDKPCWAETGLGARIAEHLGLK